ncbi:hypothetical protein A2U01_0041631, partial [Trifolium medium]|nr:hypothetical protein [Trifolium medium]
MADAIRHSQPEDNPPPRECSHKGWDRKRKDKRRESRGPPSTFTNYTQLLTSREHTLAECATSEFRNAVIKFPKQVPPKPYHDRSKYYRYHKSYGHVTEECIQLKDAIEILIRDGQIKQYVKKRENPRPKNCEASTVEEEKPATIGQNPKQVAMSISRPEDFFAPEYLEDKYAAPILTKWENFPEAMVISGGGFNKV